MLLFMNKIPHLGIWIFLSLNKNYTELRSGSKMTDDDL